MHTLNSYRVWSSQLKQTIARFEEKLATILIKVFPIAIGALTTISETNGIHKTVFANLRLRPDAARAATIFWSSFDHEEREFRSPRGDASIGTLCSRGNSHCADREPNFSDHALAFAARKSRKRKEAREGIPPLLVYCGC